MKQLFHIVHNNNHTYINQPHGGEDTCYREGGVLQYYLNEIKGDDRSFITC